MPLSPAHRKSAPFVYDPAYSAEKPFPEDPHIYEGPCYLYGKGELEAFLLQKMHKETAKARLLVGYPGDFLSPSPSGYFRAELPAGLLTFRASGHVQIALNGKGLYQSAHKDTPHELLLPHKGMLLIRLSVFDTAIDLPALLVYTGGEWEFGRTEKSFSPCVKHPRRKDGIPPHLAPFSETHLSPQKIGEDLWDMGREVLGIVEINGVKKHPSLFAGETLYEVKNEDPQHFEQSLELTETKKGVESSVPLAFRYLRIKGMEEEGEIKVRAQYPSLAYRGAFAADEELTRIYLTGAYTLKLCTRNFYVDGIKRDRLPWMGDLAVSLMSNASTFADKETVARTIRVLESGDLSKCRDINGIVDYSLWQLICHDRYQLYFKDKDFLREEYEKILERVEDLLARRDENGFLVKDCSWLLIDWCKDTKEEKFSALQILFFWALQCGARLAERMEDLPHKEKWAKEAELLKGKIYSHFFVQEKGLFAGDLEKSSFRRHGNIFAILSGLAPEEEKKRIAQALAEEELPPIGTPYMGIMECWALAKANFREAALNKIRHTWGGMLKEGATTFFEAYDASLKGEKLYAFYNRPYGLSCCHAWGSGPAFLLPLLLSGIEPLQDGWEEFALSPMEGVEEFFVTLPTPRGLIQYNVEKGKEDLIIPDGLKAVRK